MSTTYYQEMRVYVRRGLRKWTRKTSKVVFGASTTFLAINLWSGGPNPVGPRILALLGKFVRFNHNPIVFAVILTSTGISMLSLHRMNTKTSKTRVMTPDNWRWTRDTSAASAGVASTYLVKNFLIGGPNPVGRRIAGMLFSFLRFGPNPWYLAVMTVSTGIFLLVTLTEEENNIIQLKTA